MLHYSEHKDVIVMDSSAKSLAIKLQGRSLTVSSLTEAFRVGPQVLHFFYSAVLFSS